MLWLCSAVGIDPACSLEREAILNFQHPLTDELLVEEGHPVQLHIAGVGGKLTGTLHFPTYTRVSHKQFALQPLHCELHKHVGKV